MATRDFETYYSLLGLDTDASPSDIRKAYMVKSLETHPDRNNAPGATATFQHIAEAYQTLSDPYSRREYDQLLKERAQNPQNPPSWDADPVDAEETFAGVFEELLRPEVLSRSPIWQALGSISGGTLGFIVGNIPGAIAGATAGNFLGLVRDRKGKSVYDVFCQLDSGKRMEILTKLAKTVVMSTVAEAFASGQSTSQSSKSPWG